MSSSLTRGVTVQLSPIERAAVVQLQDRALNFYIADHLKELVRNAIDQAVDSGHTHVVIDFAKVEVMDSCGVEMLIRIRERVIERDGDLVLCSLRRTFQRMLEMMRLQPYFRFAESPKEALATIAATPTRS